MERMRAKTISAIFVLMALLIAFMLGYYFGGTAEAAEEPEPVQYIRTANKIAAAGSATARDGTGKYPVTSIPSREAVVNAQT